MIFRRLFHNTTDIHQLMIRRFTQKYQRQVSMIRLDPLDSSFWQSGQRLQLLSCPLNLLTHGLVYFYRDKQSHGADSLSLL
jgi:hypothetical protein